DIPQSGFLYLYFFMPPQRGELFTQYRRTRLIGDDCSAPQMILRDIGDHIRAHDPAVIHDEIVARRNVVPERGTARVGHLLEHAPDVGGGLGGAAIAGHLLPALMILIIEKLARAAG